MHAVLEANHLNVPIADVLDSIGEVNVDAGGAAGKAGAVAVYCGKIKVNLLIHGAHWFLSLYLTHRKCPVTDGERDRGGDDWRRSYWCNDWHWLTVTCSSSLVPSYCACGPSLHCHPTD